MINWDTSKNVVLQNCVGANFVRPRAVTDRPYKFNCSAACEIEIYVILRL